MNKYESKYFNTASLFDEALIILLDQKDVEYITVKEICEKAGVNRSTFYLHYETIDDLLKETVDNIIKKFINYFNKEPKSFLEEINDGNKESLILINENYLKPYLEFIKDNKRTFRAVFKRPVVMKVMDTYNSLEKYILNPILDKFEISDKKKKYYLQFYVNGIMAIIKMWVLNDCKDPITEIMNIIIECVRP